VEPGILAENLHYCYRLTADPDRECFQCDRHRWWLSRRQKKIQQVDCKHRQGYRGLERREVMEAAQEKRHTIERGERLRLANVAQ
jgi:hypothetical protein